MKKLNLLLILSFLILSFSCQTVKNVESPSQKPSKSRKKDNTITLLFAGDLMAHNVNYNMKNYDIIWEDVKQELQSSDFSFANIEAPIDQTRPASNYPYFNMPKSYVQASIDAGFNVFSLANNHTNDQELSGIKETQKTALELKKSESEKGNNVYFAGVKDGKNASYSFEMIEKNGWKILFLPMTEILNRPVSSTYINYVSSSKTKRNEFIEYCKKLREENPCDLFILGWHANEPEYIRDVTQNQHDFYNSLLEAGVDIIWANHVHLIKDRKLIIDSQTAKPKIIMYANGNIISGQRTRPDFKAAVPDFERDNTGDGLFYKVTLKKDKKTNEITFVDSQNIFITTYITPKREYIVKKMDDQFINYLNENKLYDWSNYIQKRIKINNEKTKEIIEWQ